MGGATNSANWENAIYIYKQNIIINNPVKIQIQVV